MDNNLSERKKKVLQALVDSYITSVEPISSGAIHRQYLPEVSTATIRSELAMLEEMGYLNQPHVSSGRVPSSKAYRYYVDHFIEVGDIDLAQVRESVETRLRDVEEIVHEGAKIVSDITNYTSMLMITSADNILIRDVKLVDLYDGSALVLIITDSGVVQNRQIRLTEGMPANYVDVANKLLIKAFAGKSLAQAIHNADAAADAELEKFRDLFEQVVQMVQDYKQARENQLFVEGTEKIFDYPEYRDVENVRNFMSVVAHKEKLADLMHGQGDIEYSIRIGSEESEDLRNMALVSAKYKINGKEIGQVGVIGPERMDYKKVLGTLKELGKWLGEETQDSDRE